MTDLAQIGLKTKALTLKVGEFIRSESKKFDGARVELKGLNDLVSYVDKEAEQQLVNGLISILPDAGFITEEGTADRSNQDHIWIVDPLDGTTNFIHGLPVYSISIALMHKEELVLGIVYEINKEELFYAHKNGGAWLNDQPITASPISKLSESLLATGFPYHNFEQLDTYMQMLSHFMQNTHGLRRLGSAAVDLAYVACGRFEGFFEYNLNSWDVAAGAFIVQAAGGSVTDFKGDGDYLFGRSIITSGGVSKELFSAIDSFWN